VMLKTHKPEQKRAYASPGSRKRGQSYYKQVIQRIYEATPGSLGFSLVGDGKDNYLLVLVVRLRDGRDLGSLQGKVASIPEVQATAIYADERETLINMLPPRLARDITKYFCSNSWLEVWHSYYSTPQTINHH
ncbi:MAG: hypothetical protein ACE5JC_06820, partial [Candidatus Zixiibacteriota bacterium]